MKAIDLLTDHLTELQDMAQRESFGRYGSLDNLHARRDLVQQAIQEIKDLQEQKKNGGKRS
jgi:hypothetical protein